MNEPHKPTTHTMKHLFSAILSRSKHLVRETHRAFTLIEMLVVVAIFVIVTAVVLADFPGFGSKIVLENIAYEVALGVREAQTYGVATRELGGVQFPSYGVHFYTNGNGNREFYVFADTGSAGENGEYDGPNCPAPGELGDASNTGANDACIQKFSVTGNNVIAGLCTGLSGVSFQTIDEMRANGNCTEYDMGGVAPGGVAELNVTYQRPDPDARFVARKGNGSIMNVNPGNFSNVPNASVVLVSPQGFARTVTMYSTGQISVR